MPALPTAENVLISDQQIAQRLESLAREITLHYAGRSLTVLGLLNGSIFFLVDLIRLLPAETHLDCWRVRSYEGLHSTGQLLGLDACVGDFTGRELLIVDDILDTGLTLASVVDHARSLGAHQVKTCVLLDKQRPRLREIEADWVGFTIPDAFVVGYGLDYDGAYRGLRSIHAVGEG